MKSHGYVMTTLLSAILFAGCGSEPVENNDQRATTGSTNLTGLWRVNVTSPAVGIRAYSNSSLTLVESANGLIMTDCATRESLELSTQNGRIVGLSVDLLSVDNNDTMSARSNDVGVTDASKISRSARFDMGNIQLTLPNLGGFSSSDLCTFSVVVTYLGDSVSDSITASTLYDGTPLSINISMLGTFDVGTFDVAENVSDAEAGVYLASNRFVSSFDTNRLALTSGTLTVSENSGSWIKGFFNGTISNGNALSGSFSFEKP